MSTAVVASLLEKTKDFSIEETLSFLANEYPNQVVFSTSFGQEDQVITDFIGKNHLPITIFTLDTGRLFQETYDVFHKTVKKYKTEIKTYFPETAAVERFKLAIAPIGQLFVQLAIPVVNFITKIVDGFNVEGFRSGDRKCW